MKSLFLIKIYVAQDNVKRNVEVSDTGRKIMCQVGRAV